MPQVTDKSLPACLTEPQNEFHKILAAKFKEAIKNKDQSTISSIKTTIQHYPTCEPKNILDLYLNSKTNNDLNEAVKSFTALMDCIYFNINATDSQATISSIELNSIVNQIREELRILLSELKSHHLKLNASATPAALVSRQHTASQSVIQSPMLSPKIRMSPSEDKASTRDSITKLDSHLNVTSKSMFQVQLFDNLSGQTKRRIIDYYLASNDNPYETCRLIMLGLSIFNEGFGDHVDPLISNLLDLCDTILEGEGRKIIRRIKDDSSRGTMMCRYARGLLVLDAIPLILNVIPQTNLENIKEHDLFLHTLRYYSDYCLESHSNESDLGELSDVVRKAVHSSKSTNINELFTLTKVEDQLITTMDFLCNRMIDALSGEEVLVKQMLKFRAIVSEKVSSVSGKFDKIFEIIQAIDADFKHLGGADSTAASQSESSQQPPAPKPRGRPKKKPAVTPTPVDDEVNKDREQTEIKVYNLMFQSIVQYLFINCSIYIRKTKARIFLNFNNQLANGIENELAKGPQRGGRVSKSQIDQTNSHPAKRQRISDNSEVSNDSVNIKTASNVIDIGSASSSNEDKELISILSEITKCMQFLSSDHVIFTKLWRNFLLEYNLNACEWIRRIKIDSLIFDQQYNFAKDLLEKLLSRQQVVIDSELEGHVIIDNNTKEGNKTNDENNPFGQSGKDANNTTKLATVDLRRYVQLVSCELQLQSYEAMDTLDELLTRMKQAGSFRLDTDGDSSISQSGVDVAPIEHLLKSRTNLLPQYMVIIRQNADKNSDKDTRGRDLGFLYLDAMSVLRYCTDFLMQLLDRHVHAPLLASDSAIGHTIVLSQFDWPKYSNQYVACIDWIRSQKPKSTTPQYLSTNTKFTYPDFFMYVRNQNLVEDFMALLSQGYTLDIKAANGSIPNFSPNSLMAGVATTKPQSSQTNSTSSTTGAKSASGGSSSRSGKAITTRGVNKTFKEDLKVAIISLMRVSSMVFSMDMNADFIQQSLIPFLASASTGPSSKR